MYMLKHDDRKGQRQHGIKNNLPFFSFLSLSINKNRAVGKSFSNKKENFQLAGNWSDSGVNWIQLEKDLNITKRWIFSSLKGRIWASFFCWIVARDPSVRDSEGPDHWFYRLFDFPDGWKQGKNLCPVDRLTDARCKIGSWHSMTWKSDTVTLKKATNPFHHCGMDDV